MMRKGLWLLCVWVLVLGFYSFSGFSACSNTTDKEGDQEKTTAEKTTQEQPSQQEQPNKEKPSEQSQTTDGGADAGSEEVPEPVQEEPPKEDPVQPEPNPNVGKIRWSISVQGEVRSIALSPDGKSLYVAARGLNVLNAETGAEQWNVATFNAEMSAPVVGSDGMIYVATKTAFLYAIDPATKGTSWNAKLIGEGQKYAPALGKDGTVYVAAGNAVHAFKKPGTSVWSANYLVTSGVSSPPAVGPDGTIYVCGQDKSLHAIKPSGEKLWEKALGGTEPCRYLSIDVDGTVYAGGSSLHAYAKDGQAKWSPQTRFGVVTTAVTIHQSFLYFGTFRGKLYKINKSDAKAANILWTDGVTITVNDELTYAPTIGAGGLLYIATIDATNPEVQFINPTRGRVERSVGSREPFAGHPAIGKDGTLYVGTTGGTIFAIWTDSLGLANSPWPRGLRDNQNSSLFK